MKGKAANKNKDKILYLTEFCRLFSTSSTPIAADVIATDTFAYAATKFSFITATRIVTIPGSTNERTMLGFGLNVLSNFSSPLESIDEKLAS